MSTVSTIHTLVPNATVPLGYFDEDNIRFIQDKIRRVLRREFKQDILIDRASIVRLMERALLDRIETVPKMNQRVVMYATNEFPRSSAGSRQASEVGGSLRRIPQRLLRSNNGGKPVRLAAAENGQPSGLSGGRRDNKVLLHVDALH